MLIVEKLLERKLKGEIKIKSTQKRTIFFFSESNHFLTIEKLSPDSFMFFVDNSLVNELESYLTLERKLISELILSWFMKKNEVDNFYNLTSKLQSLRSQIT